jgi:glycosyltransferase involved in cell wall biosynthesis
MSAPRVSIIVGGSLDEPVRSAVLEKRRPRIDILEMEAIYGADVYDFSRLQEEAEHETRSRLALGFAHRTHSWNLALAGDVVGRVRDADVVYATGEDIGFLLAAMMQAFRVTKPRLIVRLENPSYGRTVWRRTVFGLYMHDAVRRVDKLVGRTSSVLQYLHDVHRVPFEKLALLGEPIDTRFFSPGLAGWSRDAEVASFATEPYILSAGLEKRDYPTLIEAMQGLPVNLIIAAGSPWSHDRFGGRDVESLPDNVHIAAFTPTQLRQLYSSAAFVVVPLKPTIRVCGSSVVLEAFAMEKAVIATRTSGILDYIEDGHTGLYAQPYDVPSWRTQIMRLLEDEAEAKRLGHNGRGEVEADRNLDAFVTQIGKLFSSVI